MLVTTVYILLRHNDNTLEVLSLKNEITGAYINDSDVSVTLRDKASGAVVAGGTWPLTMNYVPASDGDYRATLHRDLVSFEHQSLIATIISDAGVGQYAEWEVDVVAITRR